MHILNDVHIDGCFLELHAFQVQVGIHRGTLSGSPAYAPALNQTTKANSANRITILIVPSWSIQRESEVVPGHLRRGKRRGILWAEGFPPAREWHTWCRPRESGDLWSVFQSERLPIFGRPCNDNMVQLRLYHWKGRPLGLAEKRE